MTSVGDGGAGDGGGSALAAAVVFGLHAAFVLFMVWAPFASDLAAPTAHAVLTPFLWAHWALNDDTCVLTVAERWLRGLPDDSTSSFFHSLVSPVYKVADGDARALAWGASAALWLVSASRVALAWRYRP